MEKPAMTPSPSALARAIAKFGKFWVDVRHHDGRMSVGIECEHPPADKHFILQLVHPDDADYGTLTTDAQLFVDALNGLASALQETPDQAVSDESVQVIHLRLCQRATELASPIAALEEAAEEISELKGKFEAAVLGADILTRERDEARAMVFALTAQLKDEKEKRNRDLQVTLELVRERKELRADLLRLRRLLEEKGIKA